MYASTSTDRSFAIRKRLQLTLLQRQKAATTLSQTASNQQDAVEVQMADAPTFAESSAHDAIVEPPAPPVESPAVSLPAQDLPPKSPPSKQAHSRMSKSRQHSTKCSMCCNVFGCISALIKHLNQQHDQHVTEEAMEFQSAVEFERWLQQVETEQTCRFVKQKAIKTAVKTTIYYYCSRSRRVRSRVVKRKRHLKVQGYSKTNHSCPAHIVANVMFRNIFVASTHSNSSAIFGCLRLIEPGLLGNWLCKYPQKLFCVKFEIKWTGS